MYEFFSAMCWIRTLQFDKPNFSKHLHILKHSLFVRQLHKNGNITLRFGEDSFSFKKMKLILNTYSIFSHLVKAFSTFAVIKYKKYFQLK